MLNTSILLTFDWKRANAYTEDSGGLFIDPKAIDFKTICKGLKKPTKIHQYSKEKV